MPRFSRLDLMGVIAAVLMAAGAEGQTSPDPAFFGRVQSDGAN